MRAVRGRNTDCEGEGRGRLKGAEMAAARAGGGGLHGDAEGGEGRRQGLVGDAPLPVAAHPRPLPPRQGGAAGMLESNAPDRPPIA